MIQNFAKKKISGTAQIGVTGQVKVEHIEHHPIRGHKANAYMSISFVYHLLFKCYGQKSTFFLELCWAWSKMDLTYLKSPK